MNLNEQRLTELLVVNRGSIAALSKQLGLSMSHLYVLCRRYNVDHRKIREEYNPRLSHLYSPVINEEYSMIDWSNAPIAQRYGLSPGQFDHSNTKLLED